jgi:hypothetical protein
MSRIFILLVLGMFANCPQAAIVSYDYEGVVTSGNGFFNALEGFAVTGTFSYDTDTFVFDISQPGWVAYDVSPSPNNFLNINIGNFGGTNYFNRSAVHNDEWVGGNPDFGIPPDAYRDEFVIVNNQGNSATIYFETQTLNPPDSLNSLLPPELIDLNDWLFANAGFGTDDGLVKFEFISLTETSIPIPPAAWLFGSALGLLGWIRRKAT